jgi:hypothetical protein
LIFISGLTYIAKRTDDFRHRYQGVAFAAIQGLNQKLQQDSKAKDAAIVELKACLEKPEQFLSSEIKK